MRHLLIALLASGCVAKGRYELLEIQLDATRAAVSARAQQQSEETRAMEARLSELEDELVLRKAELDLLRIREALSDHAVAVEREQIQVLLAEIQRLEALKEGEEPLPDGVDDLPEPDVEAGVLHARMSTLSDAMAPVLDRAGLRLEGTEAVVIVPLAQLVQEGWTTLSPRGEVLVQELAQGLEAVPGVPVRVEGHTDTVPRHSAAFPSNWERGFGAALVLLRGLEAEGAPVQLSAASLAGTKPLEGLDPTDDAQQRVELRIELDPAAQQSFDGLPDDEG